MGIVLAGYRGAAVSKKKMGSIIPQYSGTRSRVFWKAVSAATGHNHRSLYLAGILLQEMESRVLAWLAEDSRYGIR